MKLKKLFMIPLLGGYLLPLASCSSNVNPSPIFYTITFTCDVGAKMSSPIFSINIPKNTKWGDIKKPDVTIDEDDGYEGLGWYNGSKLMSDDDKISSDLSIEFKTNIPKRKIKLSCANGATFSGGISFIEIDVNNKTKWGDIKKPDVTIDEDDGYEGLGWYNGSKLMSDDDKISSDLSIEFKTNLDYVLSNTITFSCGDGVNFKYLDKKNNKPIHGFVKKNILWKDVKPPKVLLDDDYEADGWYDKISGKFLNDSTIISANIDAVFLAHAKKPTPESIQIISQPSSLLVGETGKVECRVVPSLADQSLKYANLTPNVIDIVEVNENGKIVEIKAKNVGTGIIKCSSSNFPEIYVKINIPVYSNISFADDSWENICKYANEGIEFLHNQYKKDCEANVNYPHTLIGLEKTVNINNKPHKVRVIGENHDTIAGSDKKAALTFELVTLLSDSNGLNIESHFNNRVGIVDVNNYLKSTLRSSLNDDYSGKWKKHISKDQEEDLQENKSAFQMLQEGCSALASSIKNVEKEISVYDGPNNQYNSAKYNDKLFPLTYTEIGLNKYRFAKQEGTVYDYWANHKNEDEYKKQDYNHSNWFDSQTNGWSYWLASPVVIETQYMNFSSWSINMYGLGYDDSLVDEAKGVSFAFCI